MKKFLKWSTAFLLIGVLAVGCVKNEPSNGIEAMRIAKAGLLDANAQLTLAKVQVEAAKAAVLQAKATLLQAEAERVKAKAQVELAKADLIKAKAEHLRAANDYLKQKWALKIAEMELDLQEKEAKVQAAIKQYEVTIQELDADLVKAQQQYEAAVLAFEKWKVENANALTNAQLEQLDAIINKISDVTLELGASRVALNSAKAEYSTYVNVVYPSQTQGIAQRMEQEIRTLQCQIEYQEGLVAAYTAMYNDYHGEFDAFIAGLRDQVTAWEATIVELQLAQLQAKKDIIDLKGPMDNAFYDLAWASQPAWQFQAWEAGNFVNDTDLGVNAKGVYILPMSAIGGVTLKGYGEGFDGNYVGQLNELADDINLIADTRAEFEGQGPADVEVIKAKYEKAAKEAKDAYTSNWNKWQAAYVNVQPGTGDLYKAWAASYAEYNKQVAARKKNAEDYKALYEIANGAVAAYMDGMNNTYDNGTLGQYLGSQELSAVLGGITFNASNLLEYIWGGTLIYPALDAFLTYLQSVDKMNGYAIAIKNVMDGTTPKAIDPFWTVAQAHSFIAGADAPLSTAVMPGVYNGETGKTLNDLAVADYHKWLFLYWLFEDKTLNVGMNGFEAFFQVNANSYQDATAQFMRDFFGKYSPAAYEAILKVPSTDIYAKDQTAYFKAVTSLSTLEAEMFKPFNRAWAAVDKDGKAYTAADPSKIAKVAATPATYTAPAVGEDAENAQDFFFNIEAFAGQPVYPSLDLVETYLGEDCNLWVSYAALLKAGDECDKGTSTWAGDLMLYPFAGTYAKGHFFAAIKAQRIADSYITKYNHVINGDYANLQVALEAKYDELIATRDELWNAFDEAYDAYYEAVENEDTADWMQEAYEGYVKKYRHLIEIAQKAHEDGMNRLPDGIAESLNSAEAALLELQQQLAERQNNLDIWNSGYGIFDIDALVEEEHHHRRGGQRGPDGRPDFADEEETGTPETTWWNEHYSDMFEQFGEFVSDFVLDRTEMYAAVVQSQMTKIEGLLAKLQVLEAQRAAILEAFGVTE